MVENSIVFAQGCVKHTWERSEKPIRIVMYAGSDNLIHMRKRAGTFRPPALKSNPPDSKENSRESENLKSSDPDAKDLPALPLPQRKRAKFQPPGLTGGDRKKVVTESSKGGGALDAPIQRRYYTVLYTKRAPNKAKKNKRYEDAVLEVTQDNGYTLYNADGKVIAKSRVKDTFDMPTGAELVVGNWEVEVDEGLDAEKFRSGDCFLNDPVATSPAVLIKNIPTGPRRKPLHSKAIFESMSTKIRQLFDPNAPNALVLNKSDWEEAERKQPGNCQVSPVVVDPVLCKALRPHQREGIQFMYECIMGLREANRYGAVLADDMGLGKTLQVIGLIWTLLKQGPQGRPIAKKVIVVTPSSLVDNWKKEIQKWLGDARLKCLVVRPSAESDRRVRDFRAGAVYSVLIISYELLRRFAKKLAGCCDLIVCDEGHRLKSAQGNKTIDALLMLECPRRILLTGTPIQNKLDEFYAMLSFVNPDLLGSLSVFNRLFAQPISCARDRNASEREREMGEERSRALNERVAKFVLRRTSDLNSKHLPPLSMYVVFCKPSELQVQLYNAILRSGSVRSVLSDSHGFGDLALGAITVLRKLCNHPGLLQKKTTSKDIYGNQNDSGSAWDGLDDILRSNRNLRNPGHSGKMHCLEMLLKSVMQDGQDSIVVVSNSTAALDLVHDMCIGHGFETVRIDGRTCVQHRQGIVDAFNASRIGQVFLLSTRAGGAGLNLIGANRLVLFDSDWNPAVDQQAMARIWRDGQKKPCVVYRLLTTGTIDEKIFQRQLMKNEIADVISKQQKGTQKFTKEELKELFSLNLDTDCDTRDILAKASNPKEWENYIETCPDESLKWAVESGTVSFIHTKQMETSSLSATGPNDEEASCASLPAKETDKENKVDEEMSDDDIDCLDLD